MATLRKVLRRAGRTVDETDDLIQDAFVRLYMYRLSRQVNEPEAFLVRTVKNLYIDRVRQRSNRGVHETLDPDVLALIDPRPLPEDVLADQQKLRRLTAGLAELHPRTSEVLMLYRFEGCSHAQIGARLGISVSAVEKHIAKGVLFLTEWMSEERS
ncbi:RNA polymerase sigma factor [Steroidobacter sp.]|uniref:RNA polymerase sigma factor n=1 Tax=Steroidobacter sp. TaxID=1978227 RepID=UPI001A5D1FFE|nr:RNA polymerase sigma factor [Steroidobacter sp.]MBL8265262.1 RNA polymerase sigma factor [Steroidobacter sp.]